MFGSQNARLVAFGEDGWCSNRGGCCCCRGIARLGAELDAAAMLLLFPLLYKAAGMDELVVLT
jgi:hypothetical protein